MRVLPGKTTGETASHRFEPELRQFENITSETVSVDAGTVTVALKREIWRGSQGVTMLVFGGAAGETARFSVDVVTSEGRTVTGVFSIGVLAEAPYRANTARDVCRFALRKVTGNGVASTAAELDDALERLNDMIAAWRIQSLDIGIAGNLAAGTVLAIPDAYISALKFCLRKDLHDFYEVPLSALDVERAREAQESVRAHVMRFNDLTFDRGIIPHPDGWDYTRGY